MRRGTGMLTSVGGRKVGAGRDGRSGPSSHKQEMAPYVVIFSRLVGSRLMLPSALPSPSVLDGRTMGASHATSLGSFLSHSFDTKAPTVAVKPSQPPRTDTPQVDYRKIEGP